MSFKTDKLPGSIKLYALTLLRIAIGWHFLFEGISKAFTPSWTSADFLLLSNWIFAGFFHWIAGNHAVLGAVDFAVTWGLIVIGLALFVGLFDRSSAVAGMALIAMFWIANPPLTSLDFGVPHEGNYLVVDKNLVEFFALLVLALFPTGRDLGLGVFLKNLRSAAAPVTIISKKDPVEPVSEEGNGKLDRRTVIRGLSSLPVLGLFGYSLLRQKQWEKSRTYPSAE
jgi:thiosulfate dehydrogenase [quinone] large subunit